MDKSTNESNDSLLFDSFNFARSHGEPRRGYNKGLICSMLKFVPGFRRFLTHPTALKPPLDGFGMTRSLICWSKKEFERSLEFLFRHSIIISLSFRTHEGRHVRRRMGEESPESWDELLKVYNNLTQSPIFSNTRNGHPLLQQCTYPVEMYCQGRNCGSPVR